MTANLIIRGYEERDEPAALALLRQLQAFELPLNPHLKPVQEVGPDYIANVQADCAKWAGEILLAESDGLAVGLATIFTRVVNSDPIEIAFTYAYIGDLVVTEGLRGRGIGRALLAACEARSRAAGTRWLRIGALAGNHAARRAYTGFGFAEQHVSLEKRLE